MLGGCASTEHPTPSSDADLPPDVTRAPEADATHTGSLEGVTCAVRVEPWRVGGRLFLSGECTLRNESSDVIEILPRGAWTLLLSTPGGDLYEAKPTAIGEPKAVVPGGHWQGSIFDLREYFTFATPGTYRLRIVWNDSRRRSIESPWASFSMP